MSALGRERTLGPGRRADIQARVRATPDDGSVTHTRSMGRDFGPGCRVEQVGQVWRGCADRVCIPLQIAGPQGSRLEVEPTDNLYDRVGRKNSDSRDHKLGHRHASASATGSSSGALASSAEVNWEERPFASVSLHACCVRAARDSVKAAWFHHRIARLSLSEAATRALVVEKMASRITVACGTICPTGAPVRALQKRAVSFPDPVASNLASGEKATVLTSSAC